MPSTTFAERVPGVSALAALFRRLSGLRAGRVPIGLVAMLPVALFIDLFDAADELALGPLGMFASFVIESAFLLAITGRPGRAIGFAGLDVIPVLDVIPWSTILLVREIVRAWNQPDGAPAAGEPKASGPIIDV